MATSQTGCVPMVEEGQFRCGLVFVQPSEAEPGQPVTKAQVRASRGARRSFEKEIFTGQGLDKNPENYVILNDTRRSVGVLGQPAQGGGAPRRSVVSRLALEGEWSGGGCSRQTREICIRWLAKVR